ncbi:P-loop containing nucleoside triphosphate hydrolase [Pseudocohnilembus persalinus]|uniref:p-loop containing nucleoside triphosphate hydrolase n=1 Tax=Pseudocohnilembus persalinus TaxID=266149 RepID=A0A0V0QP25_PSEPJ|nr:P-loop containing nucleoside triphosphate hydrolase [Pseudocohnilembus persalinus]|eukprot:KRX03857.1 P-loop containing nucleoside triphosphate hydrolase [Pseudocohnilembus persalinus]
MSDQQQSKIMKQVAKYKLVLIGDQSVGKTSIINRFIYDNYTANQQPTVGIDFVAKTLHLDNKTIRLQLWDTAGQERFRSLIPSYIRDSNCAIITYDVTSTASFQGVDRWLDYVKEERGEEVLIFLVGNKNDMEEQRQVSYEQGQKFAQQQGIEFIEVSAKEGTNIQQLFKEIAVNLQNQNNQSNHNLQEIKIDQAQKSQPVQLSSQNTNNNLQQGGISSKCQQC